MSQKENYEQFLSEVRKASGIEALVADESGLVSVRVDDAYNVNLQFVEATGKVICFVEVAELPKDASKEVYRDLLAGGLLNGMRTFHFFTIPDEDGLKNGGNGNGPRRRLFLKCETFGIFCSTAHLRIFNKPASVAEGMKTRGYRFGDVLDYMFAPLEAKFGNEKYGDVGNRIGNEIMIGEKDLLR